MQSQEDKAVDVAAQAIADVFAGEGPHFETRWQIEVWSNRGCRVIYVRAGSQPFANGSFARVSFLVGLLVGAGAACMALGLLFG